MILVKFVDCSNSMLVNEERVSTGDMNNDRYFNFMGKEFYIKESEYYNDSSKITHLYSKNEKFIEAVYRWRVKGESEGLFEI